MQARTSDPSLFPNFARRISNLIYIESVIFVNGKRRRELLTHLNFQTFLNEL